MLAHTKSERTRSCDVSRLGCCHISLLLADCQNLTFYCLSSRITNNAPLVGRARLIEPGAEVRAVCGDFDDCMLRPLAMLEKVSQPQGSEKAELKSGRKRARNLDYNPEVGIMLRRNLSPRQVV